MARPIFSHLLQLAHASGIPIKFRTATATITTGENVIVGDTTGGNVTLTLPPTTAVRGHVITVVKKVAANTLTVQRAGSDTIGYGGATSVPLAAQDANTVLVSDGAGVWIKLQ